MKEDKDKKEEKQKRKSTVVTIESIGAVGAVFSLLAFFILITGSAVFGGIGTAIKSFLLGVFGYGSYLLLPALFTQSGAKFLGKKIFRRKFSYLFTVLSVFFIMLFIHSITTASWSMDGYLYNCFKSAENGAKSATFAGWLGGLVVFALRAVLKNVGAIIVIGLCMIAFVALAVRFVLGKAFFEKLKGKNKKDKANIDNNQGQNTENNSYQNTNPAYNGMVNDPYMQNGQAYNPNNQGYNPSQNVYQNNSYNPVNNNQNGNYQGDYYQNGQYVNPNPNYNNPSYNNGVTYYAQGGQPYQGSQGSYNATPEIRQRPEVRLNDNSGAYSPFSMQDSSKPRETPNTAPDTSARDALFMAPAESYRKNLIFDNNAQVNKRPFAPAASQLNGGGANQVPANNNGNNESSNFNSSYTSAYADSVNNGNARPTKIFENRDYTVSDNTSSTPYNASTPIVETPQNNPFSLNDRQTPDYSSRQTPDFNIRQTSDFNTRQTPDYNSRQTLDFNTRQTSDTAFTPSRDSSLNSSFGRDSSSRESFLDVDKNDNREPTQDLNARGDSAYTLRDTPREEPKETRGGREEPGRMSEDFKNLFSTQNPNIFGGGETNRNTDFSTRNENIDSSRSSRDSSLNIFDEPVDSRLDTRDSRLDSRDNRLDSPSLDTRDSRLDSRDNRLDSPSLDTRDSRLDSRDNRMDPLDTRDSRLDSRDTRMDSRDDLVNRGNERAPERDLGRAPERDLGRGSDRDIIDSRGSLRDSTLDNSRAETPREVEPEKPREVIPEKPPVPKVIRPYTSVPLTFFDCADVIPDSNAIEVEENKETILATLNDYKVTDATIASVTYGPTVTRYNVAIPRSISPKKVVSLDQEIAICLHAAKGVNIYPNFEDGAVSIEVPNKNRQFVTLGCMLMDDRFINAKPNSLTFAMGKDVGNKKVFGDIRKMTHILVAGTSGSGKSVFLHSLIISLIYRYSPADLRLIIIDPKRTEFVVYNHLPHLIVDDIISDIDKVIRSLEWSINEMNRRYSLFEKKSRSGTYVVSIDEYNANLLPGEEKLPKIVIIVDELADLMLADKKNVEDRIQNLTQKSRAAGIHMILTTQRPSADVITGTIKSNLKTRIALSVASDVDSRVILDMSGANKLLGKGDMLYITEGDNTPVRLQSPSIMPEATQKVVSYIREHNDCVYDEKVAAFINKKMPTGDINDVGGGEEIVEGVYIDALRCVIESGSASISMIQRKCSVGYNKAGKIVEWMEDQGFISKFDGAKARKVLITKEEFDEKYGDL